MLEPKAQTIQEHEYLVYSCSLTVGLALASVLGLAGN